MKDQLEELACLYVLDQLDTHERAVFEARLLREPELAATVRDLESSLSRSIRALPQHEPPAATFAQIESQIAALPTIQAAAATPSFHQPATISWASFARWGLAAVIAISLTTIAVQSLRRPAATPTIVFIGLDLNRNTFAELPLQEPAKDADSRFIQLASLAQNFWEKPADLPGHSTRTRSGSRGYALFDPGSAQGFIAVEQIPEIGDSQRYHLWVLDPASGQVRDAGVLPLSGRHSGLYSFTLNAAGKRPTERPRIFITVEDASTATTAAPTTPRGKVVLGNQRI